MAMAKPMPAIKTRMTALAMRSTGEILVRTKDRRRPAPDEWLFAMS
jgi:hypothetical protein